MKPSLQSLLEKHSVMVIDGSFGTALENVGVDLHSSLWTARALAVCPELVKQVHVNYFRAGADCGISGSYQATIPGLVKSGYTPEEAESLIRRSVVLLREAREEWWAEEGAAQGRAYPLCLGSVGPYGAYLADGSEYTGNYHVSDGELYDFHARRMELLWEAGADMLLIETQPSLREAKIEAQIAEELGAEYWISFSCRDRERTSHGELVRDCAREFSTGHPHLRMLGVNCTKPEFVVSLIQEIKTVTALPIAVYPNSGESYDPTTKSWSGDRSGVEFGQYALRYMMAGASAVGGCCTTVYQHIRQVAQAREEFLAMGKPATIRL